MMTVKFVGKLNNADYERVLEASKVEQSGDSVSVTLSSGAVEVFSGSGTLYVMNEMGQTVSRYSLGRSQSADFRYPPAPTQAEITSAVERAQPDALELAKR